MVRSPSVRHLIRHAERYGTAGVWDRALAQHLDAGELGSLARRLRAIDPDWRLSNQQANDLAVSLLEAGMPEKQVALTVGRSRTTLWRLRRER